MLFRLVPHTTVGELAIAFVVPCGAVDGEQRTAFCRARFIHHNVLEGFVFVPEQPNTANGKVRKGVLKEALQKELADRKAGDTSQPFV